MSKKSDIKKKKIIVVAFLIIALLLIIAVIYGITSLISSTKVSSGDNLNSIDNINDLYTPEFVNTIETEAIIEESDVPIEEDPIEAPSPTPTSEENTPSTSYNTKYYVKINLAANVVNVYTKDSKGDYTVPVKGFICSTGTATPKSGVYKTTGYKKRWNHLQGNVDGQYATQIVGNILFHSVPYTKQDVSALEYWEYDKLGTSASLGCIRMTVADVKWIYDNITKGTPIEFYSDAKNPGPFGKPKAQKISDNIACRNWDPTDFAEGNPWRTWQASPSPTITPTPKPTITQTPTPTSVPSQTPSPTSSITPTPTETAPVQTPTASPTLAPTMTPTPSQTVEPLVTDNISE